MYVCPSCRETLALAEGKLVCRGCGSSYPVRNGIPRFVDSESYAHSFGFQWRKFAKTQIAGPQKAISQARFDATTGWPKDLRGQVILEAGCGAGRFSEIALDTGAEVYSFDLSEAVEANRQNTSRHERLGHFHLFQADIYRIPLPHGMFDKIFCLGVLQHCPDVRKAFLSLVPFLKPGGELVVDCYLSQPLKHAFGLKYWLRPFVAGWPPPRLFHFCESAVSISYDLKSALSKMPGAGAFLSALVPIGRLHYEPEYHFSADQMKEVKSLSLFDMLSPRHDKCQRISNFRVWAGEAGLEMIHLGKGYNGINAIARRSRADEAPVGIS